MAIGKYRNLKTFVVTFLFLIISILTVSHEAYPRNWDWDQNHDCVQGIPNKSGWCKWGYDGYPADCDAISIECCELLCKICPVYAYSGRYQKTFTDLTVPGVGPTLAITRTYNSQEWASSLLGYSWTFNFGRKLIITRNMHGEKIIGVLLETGEKNYYKEDLDGALTRLTDYGATYELVKNGDNTYTIVNRDGTWYELRQDGKIDKIIDKNNNELVFTYNTVGCLSRITNASGNHVDFQLGPNGKIASVSDNLGRTISYTYDQNGNLISVIDPLGNTTQYIYNSDNFLTQIIDARGNVVETAGYDNHEPPRVSTFTEKGETYTIAYFDGRTEKTDSQGNKWTYYFNAVGVIEKVVDPLGNETNRQLNKVTAQSVDWEDDLNGNRTSYTYDGDGNIASKTDPLGNTWTYSYIAGAYLLETETNPLGIVTKYEYDGKGNQTAMIRDFGGPLENRSSYTYDSQGNQTSATDPLGNTTTTYEYDANGNLIRVTDPLGNVTTYTYDSMGNRLSVTDALGNTTTYDLMMNRLVSVVDALGNTTTYAYDANGNKVSETVANGDTRSFAYDAYNRLVQETDPFGNVTSAGYDSMDNLISKTDANGNTTTYSYDILNHMVRETNALGGHTNYVHDAEGNILSITDANGNTSNYIYDAENRRIYTQHPDGSIEEVSYNSIGLVRSKKDGNGNIINFTHDTLGRLNTATNPDGTVNTSQYDANENLISKIDENGNKILYTYDARNRLIQLTYPDGFTIIYNYDPNGNNILRTFPSGKIVQYSYDSMNRIIQMSDSTGLLKKYTYDALGNNTSVTTSAGSVFQEHDAMGRTVKIADSMNLTQSFQYDKMGNLTAKTDSEGNIISYSYDALNRVTSVDVFPQVNGQASSTYYAYDKKNNIIQLTNANGNTTEYVYDSMGRLTKEIYPDTTERIMAYDNAGNRIYSKDLQGNVATFLYGDRNNPVRVDYSDGNFISYLYSPNGQLVLAENNHSKIVYAYDSNNRIVSTTQRDILNTYSYTTTYTYDVFLNKRTITYPSGKIVEEILTKRNQLNKVKESGRTEITIDYDSADQLLTINYLNGTKTQFDYDSGGRTISFSHSTINGSILAGAEYTYDNAGNKLISKNLIPFDVSKPFSYSEKYIYDDTYRLVESLSGELNNIDITNPIKHRLWILDAVGNWEQISVDGVVYNNAINNMNEYDQFGFPSNQNNIYDNNGNLVDDGLRTFEYDNHNFLTSIIRKSDGKILARFKYDAMHRRIAKIDDSRTVIYVYDGLRVIEEYEDGIFARSFIYGNGYDEVLTMEDRAGNKFYYHLNDLGSVVAITDKDGMVIERYTYDVYGYPTISDNSGAIIGYSTIGNPYFFAGRRWNHEISMYYNRLREYDPTRGRFLQRDPLGFNENLNQYAYVMNNPVNWIDPTGLKRASDWDLNVSIGAGAYYGIGGAVEMTINADIEECCTSKGVYYPGGNKEIIAEASAQVGIGIGAEFEFGPFKVAKVLKGPQFRRTFSATFGNTECGGPIDNAKFCDKKGFSPTISGSIGIVIAEIGFYAGTDWSMESCMTLFFYRRAVAFTLKGCGEAELTGWVVFMGIRYKDGWIGDPICKEFLNKTFTF